MFLKPSVMTEPDTIELKEKLLAAFKQSVSPFGPSVVEEVVESVGSFPSFSEPTQLQKLAQQVRTMNSVPEQTTYSPLDALDTLFPSPDRSPFQQEAGEIPSIDDTLSVFHPDDPMMSEALPVINQTYERKGDTMADLSGYKDLSKPPVLDGEPKSEGGGYTSVLTSPLQPKTQNGSFNNENFSGDAHGASQPEFGNSDFNRNFQTLIRLINELPEGVTKQTGAQIIRLTMESMGIFMEDVLSDAQSAQSEMLDAVRANIKKIEEYKTIIRKLESDIKYYQGKANELSEIIDLFILSNSSSKVSHSEELR